ncbi:MAG TPA: DUF3617 family protein [Edaphobacter sp.]
MKALLLLAITALQMSSGAPVSTVAAPPLPPIRWGLWESKVTGAPGMDGEMSVTRSCVSAATWKGFMDTHGDDSNHCVWSNQTATPTTYSADMSCAAGKITGHAVMTIDSLESFQYTMSVAINKDAEHASHFEIDAKAKFIGTDCYGLKPGEEIDVWE